MKANKVQHSPKLQNSLLSSLFNVKSSTNMNMIPEKCVFKRNLKFYFHYINSLKLHFVENVSVPTNTNEIMVLSTLFVSILPKSWKWGHFMLPKNGHSVKKKYFLYSISKIYDVNYYQKHRKNIFLTWPFLN